ncbi:MAG TPA: aspartate kinase [bacterium]|nr:aspartate kinase [bacterium]
MIVMKIGGSSLRSVESLRLVAGVIHGRPEPEKIVVLSAVSGVTNHLLRSVGEAMQSERRIGGLLDYLNLLHRELILGTISDSRIQHRVLDEVAYLISRLEKLLYGIAYTGECSRRMRDLIISMGERMAVQLLAGALQQQGLEAQALDADKIDIVASGEFGNGNAELDTTARMLPQHLHDLLRRGGIPVITGFFGRTPGGHTITFGRGGTDYSAAIIAHAMEAEELQIWKDVDGFLTANPEIVPEARPLDYLAYDEAAELSYFGAAILHPRTVEPLSRKGIPAVIRNTYRPDAPGTRIGAEKQQHQEIIKSVVTNSDIGMLRLHGASLGQQVGFLKTAVSALSDAEINIISVITAQTAVNLLLGKGDVERSARLVEGLHIAYVDQIEPVTDVALIGVVGEGLDTTRGLAARVFKAVAGAGANVEMIASGASRVTQYFIIKERDRDATVRAIHSEFFGSPAQAVRR